MELLKSATTRVEMIATKPGGSLPARARSGANRITLSF